MFLVPALFLVFAGLFVPAIRTIYVSFYDDREQEVRRVRQLPGDLLRQGHPADGVQQLHLGRRSAPLFVVVVGLAIARFADGMKGERVAKSLIFIPAAISLAGAGIVWRFVYAGPPFEVGLLNQVTKAIPDCRPAWAATATSCGCSTATSAASPHPTRRRA